MALYINGEKVKLRMGGAAFNIAFGPRASYYATLVDAVNDVNVGTVGVNAIDDKSAAVSCVFYENEKPVVTLLKDSMEATRVQTYVDMIINLGGHILSANNSVCIDVRDGNLVVDGRLKGSAIVQNSTSTVTCFYVGSASSAKSLTVKGGIYEAVSTSGTSYAISSTSTSANVNIEDCIMKASNSTDTVITVRNHCKTTISNCTIQAYSNRLSSAIYGQGILNVSPGTLTLNNCRIMGTHSGVCIKGGMLYINGGTYEGHYGGGIMFEQSSNTSYIRDAILSSMLTMPDGYESNGTLGCSFGYTSGVSNSTVYIDNCNMYGSADTRIIDFAGSSNSLYISNSTINNLLGGSANIRIAGTNNILYIGVGNNFSAENTTNPGNVVVTNEVYVQDAA